MAINAGPDVVRRRQNVSLLNFLFKDKQEKLETADPDFEQAIAPLPEEIEEAELAQTENFEPDLPEPEFDDDDDYYNDDAPTLAAIPDSSMPRLDQDTALTLDEIREALAKIAEIINDDAEESKEDEKGDFTVVDLTIAQIAELVPHVFLDIGAIENPTQTVPVKFPELYRQLSGGKVSTTVGRMLAAMSEELLVPDYEKYRKDDVDVPLNLVVGAVKPEELMQRTSVEERDDGMDDMPNLFSGSAFDDVPAGGIDLSGGAFPSADESPEPTDSQELSAAESSQEPAVDSAAPLASTTGDEVFQRGADAFSRIPGAEDASAGIPGLDDSSRLSFDTDEDGDEGADKNEVPEFEFDEEDAFVEPLVEVEEEDAFVEPIVDVEENTSSSDIVEEDVLVDENPGESLDETAVEPAVDLQMPVEQFVSADLDVSEQTAEPAESVAPAVTSGSPVHGTVIGDLDVNTADADALAAGLGGVGPKLAARIVRFRELNGQFERVQDLARVPGVGPTTYFKMTGDSWSEARDTIKRSIDDLLGGDTDSMPDLEEVALRFVDLPGFEGCIFTHAEGHVIAACWNNKQEEVLAVIAPQIFKKMLPYAEQLELGELNPVTLFLEGKAVTVMECGNVYFAAIHDPGKFSRKQLNLVHLVGSELEQRMERAMQSVF
jgi:competence protein ComEA